MALNGRSAIDPRWYTHNRGIEKALELCTIDIIEPATSDAVYDVTTNSWTTDTTTIWTGKARIQVRSSNVRQGSPLSPMNGIDPVNNLVMEVHIGLKENQLTGSNGAMPDVRPGHRIFTTSSPLDPILENFELVVRSVINSSNPWHRTLLCEVNQDFNPNNG